MKTTFPFSLFNHRTQLLLDLFTAIAQGRSQARSVKLLAVERPPAAYASLAAVLSAARCHIVNAYSDPYGWASEIDSSAEDGNQGKTAAAAAPAAAAAACDLQALEAMLIQVRHQSRLDRAVCVERLLQHVVALLLCAAVLLG